MPHLDATFNPVQDSDKTAHMCVWVSMSSSELTRQLKACTEKFAEWKGAAPTLAFRYADGMGWTMEVARIAPAVDDKKWSSTYVGWTPASAIFEMAFEHVEKCSYPDEATFVTALIAGASKVDRAKLDAAQLVEADFHKCKAMAAGLKSSSKEDAVTWGLLRRCHAGLRAAAFLERGVTEDRHEAGPKPVIQFIFDAAVERGRIDASETEEKKWAFSLVHELSSKIVTPPAFFVYTMMDGDRMYDVELRTTEAGDQFDGESDFCQARTPGLVSVCAPVIADVLHGVTDMRAFNSALLEIASIYDPTRVPSTPKHIFTVHGMKALGRAAAPYAVWAEAAKTTYASPEERVAAFVNRVRLNDTVSLASDGGGTGGGGTGIGDPATGNYGASGGRAAGEAWRQALTRVRELGDNPAIVNDIIKMVSTSGHDPLAVLAVALTGHTLAHPKRASTTLTRMLGTGRIAAQTLDARLAPLTIYAATLGGRYLGRIVGDLLVALHLADEEAVEELTFNDLWDVLRGKHDPKPWKETLDFYNLLIIELVRQVQCEGTLFDIAVASVPYDIRCGLEFSKTKST